MRSDRITNGGAARSPASTGAAGATALLRRLAMACGVAPSSVDEAGVRRKVGDHSLRRVLSLLGVAADTPEQVRASLRERRVARWRRPVEPVLVVRQGRASVTMRLPISPKRIRRMHVAWQAKLEDGSSLRGRQSGRQLTIVEQAVVDGVEWCEFAIPLSRQLPPGYHTLALVAKGEHGPYRAATKLIVVPRRGYVHPLLRGARKVWGLTVQLYGIRSNRNWGIGDFRDLMELMRWAGKELGAALVGVNPLHALPHGQISPYSPSSRLFHHPLYLAIEDIPEFLESAALQALVASRPFQRRLASLRANPLVQYRAVERIKWEMLNALYRLFYRRHAQRHTRRAAEFARFVASEGTALERFAVFRMLGERLGRRRGKGQSRTRGWRSWPDAYRNADSPAVERAAARYRDRVRLFQYVEWQCQQQIHSVQAAAVRYELPIGLYKDMAVGIDPRGADAWAFQDQVVSAVSVGTPPELFSPSGQRWNLTPFHPSHIRDHAYRLFADCYRRTMQGSGIIRIDHAMGMFRLFWIPDGLAPAEGTYVRYPSYDCLGILALESRHRKVRIIGEDLGTVTPAIRAKLAAGGLLSYRLLLFEQTAKGAFAKPSCFPRHAAAAIATHDLPTLRGFWIARDIEWKRRLKLYRKPEWRRRDEVNRAHDRQALLDAVGRERLLPVSCSRNAAEVPVMTDELCRAVYAYVARTPSLLLLVSLEDVLGDVDTPNIPGNHGYPCWQIKAGPPGIAWKRGRISIGFV